jgi:hypothetical protein
LFDWASSNVPFDEEIAPGVMTFNFMKLRQLLLVRLSCYGCEFTPHCGEVAWVVPQLDGLLPFPETTDRPLYLHGILKREHLKWPVSFS